jgi:hypothetical protein
MEQKNIMLSEIIQIWDDKCHVYSLIFGIQVKIEVLESGKGNARD